MEGDYRRNGGVFQKLLEECIKNPDKTINFSPQFLTITIPISQDQRGLMMAEIISMRAPRDEERNMHVISLPFTEEWMYDNSAQSFLDKLIKTGILRHQPIFMTRDFETGDVVVGSVNLRNDVDRNKVDLRSKREREPHGN